MNSGRKYLLLTAGAIAITSLLTTSIQATTFTIVDDSFADGDLAKTGALDTPWFTSSSSSGIEISTGSLGLVTGTSGRGIHTVFPTQTLVNIGDSIKASFTFTTPTTIDVSGGNSSAFRVGLYDTLGRTGPPNDPNTESLAANVTASSSGGPPGESGPNPVYGIQGFSDSLPGFLLDYDVYNNSDLMAAAGSDLNFRRHIAGQTSGTGRLMATTSGFNNDTSSGPDAGYVFDPNTQYSGSLEIELLNATEVQLTGTLDGHTHTVVDTFDSLNFGFFGFHTNSNKFGSSNSAGDPDNGIDFSNITIETHVVPEPSSLALILGAITLLPGMARRRR